MNDKVIVIEKRGIEDFHIYEYDHELGPALSGTTAIAISDPIERFAELEKALNWATKRKPQYGIEYIDSVALSRIEFREFAEDLAKRLMSEGFHAGPALNNVRILRKALVEVKIKVLKNIGHAGDSWRQEHKKSQEYDKLKSICDILEGTCVRCNRQRFLEGRCTPYRSLLKFVFENSTHKLPNDHR